jgi:dihydrodipicolinate synthase/N-acetylneuraminate lyase
MMREIDPMALLRPGRQITGMSAVLLPFTESGDVDWAGLRNHIERTVEAGLIPAVNMDTGYADLIDEATRCEVLALTEAVCAGGTFVAGAFVRGRPGDPFDEAAYARAIEAIEEANGTPIVFQSYGLTGGDVLAAYERIATHTDRFFAFELGQMFAPFGAIYDLETYAGLLTIDACAGAKHSSLDRTLEWERLSVRDERRPDFMVLTGNDLAIDMVMYGSDYLLGLSTLAPDWFGRRDACWAAGDVAGFLRINDLLQYLGHFAFRRPVPAYKHSAAQFLKLRGWIGSDRTPPGVPRRPESDVAILRALLEGPDALA